MRWKIIVLINFLNTSLRWNYLSVVQHFGGTKRVVSVLKWEKRIFEVIWEANEKLKKNNLNYFFSLSLSQKTNICASGLVGERGWNESFEVLTQKLHLQTARAINGTNSCFLESAIIRNELRELQEVARRKDFFVRLSLAVLSCHYAPKAINFSPDSWWHWKKKSLR